jgi:membrane protease YdiL (CAAX protease family)
VTAGPAPYPGWPYSPPPQPQPPSPLPPLEYHQLYRAGRPGWWWAGLAALPLLLVFVFIAGQAIILAFMVGFVATGQPVEESVDALVDFDPLAPLDLAFVNLVLGSLIVFAFVAVFALHGLKPGWLTSVAPRMRWTYFVACIGLSILALTATVLVSLVLPSGTTGDMSGELNSFTSTTRDFLLVILLLTPLQAAGEEYVFRGYITQAIGSLFPTDAAVRVVSRCVAVIVPAVLFALAHGIGQPLPIFFDRLAFGLVAGVLVIATGGLEAALAMHVLNNFVAYALALAYGDMSETLAASEGTWWMIPATLTQSLVYLGLAVVVARAMGLARTADPAVLAASQRRV